MLHFLFSLCLSSYRKIFKNHSFFESALLNNFVEGKLADNGIYPIQKVSIDHSRLKD